MVIKCKLKWLFAGTQSPPQELHHESLSAERQEGGGEGALAMDDVSKETVTEMQKEVDSEVLKMMQLQNQVVNHIQTTHNLHKRPDLYFLLFKM